MKLFKAKIKTLYLRSLWNEFHRVTLMNLLPNLRSKFTFNLRSLSFLNKTIHTTQPQQKENKENLMKVIFILKQVELSKTIIERKRLFLHSNILLLSMATRIILITEIKQWMYKILERIKQSPYGISRLTISTCTMLRKWAILMSTGLMTMSVHIRCMIINTVQITMLLKSRKLIHHL